MFSVKKLYVKSCQFFIGENSHWLACWSQAEGGDSKFNPKDQPEHFFYIIDLVLGAVRRYWNIFI